MEAVRYARAAGLDLLVLGGGSNMLVADQGFDGLVVQIKLKGITKASDGSVTVMAGEDWDAFVARCVAEDLAGIECMSGIPGFVGGTPIQNVGAYGQEVSTAIVSVECLDRRSNEVVRLANSECGFAYRASIFNSSDRDRYIVLSVTFSLVEGGSASVVYKDLKEYFDGREPSLAEVREAVIKIRSAKSMVIDSHDPNSRSAGSFFKNPIVTAENLNELAAELGIEVPHFAAPQGMAKIPAAWLIERAGFHKGYQLGQAGISANHSLALINRGGASASDILALKDRITTAIEDRFGITLVPEPIFVGF